MKPKGISLRAETQYARNSKSKIASSRYRPTTSARNNCVHLATCPVDKARRQPMRTRAMVREVRQRAHRRQYPESSHRLRPVSRTRRPRHAPTQHHTQRRKRMEGSDRRHQRITLSTKRTAGTIHRLPAVPLIGDPITKNDYYPRRPKRLLTCISQQCIDLRTPQEPCSIQSACLKLQLLHLAWRVRTKCNS